MGMRFASLLSVAILGAAAMPAAAQAGPDAPPLPPMRDFHDGPPPMRHMDRGWREAGPESGPRFGYSPEERDRWLDECSGGYAPNDPPGRERGAVTGGAIGAIGGGIAGNRLARRGDRLRGTAIGAGAGAVAGAAIGAAIGEHGDRARQDRRAFCDDYLARYEGLPALAGPAGPYPPMAYPYPGMVTPGYVMPSVVWVKVPIVRAHSDCGCEEVIEEEVITKEAPRARRVIRRPVGDKRIRYSK